MSIDPHAENVLAVLRAGGAPDKMPAYPPSVIASWERSLHRHRLDPHRIALPAVITTAELNDAMTPLEEMLTIAKPEIDRLFARLANTGSILTLNDAAGRTLMLRCSASMSSEVSASGLLVGSIWSEASQGTNGIGICIEEKKAVLIETHDHFSSRLIDLSCTVSPIFGGNGELVAVLNVTTSQSRNPSLHALIHEVVVGTTTRIENIWFERRHADAKILRLSRFDDFNDLSLEARLALDSAGKVIDATANVGKTLMLGDRRVIGDMSHKVLGLTDSELWRTEGRACQLPREDGHRVFFQPQSQRHSGAFGGEIPRPAHGARASGSASANPNLADLVGHAPALMNQVHIARRLVDRRLPILIQGETGTGKSALAKALHRQSVHSSGNFVAINCAAIPKDLIESELFGHRPGAFTGASKHGSRGRILEADGGTLFLDEIGDMPIGLQSRLLHVIAEGELVPIGGVAPVKVEFALVSASLHDLEDLVRKGLFREDLYFRLNGSTLRLPPLRQRTDRAMLMDAVLVEEARSAGRECMHFAPPVRKLLSQYPWPGNIRELKHLVRFAVTLCDGAEIGLSDLPERFSASSDEADSANVNAEREMMKMVLEQTAWNVSQAAERLGLSRATLHRKILQFDLKRP